MRHGNEENGNRYEMKQKLENCTKAKKLYENFEIVRNLSKNSKTQEKDSKWVRKINKKIKIMI